MVLRHEHPLALHRGDGTIVLHGLAQMFYERALKFGFELRRNGFNRAHGCRRSQAQGSPNESELEAGTSLHFFR